MEAILETTVGGAAVKLILAAPNLELGRIEVTHAASAVIERGLTDRETRAAARSSLLSSVSFTATVAEAELADFRRKLYRLPDVPASALESGRRYVLVDAGDTDWTEVGAQSGDPGEYFVASGAGSGTGRARPVDRAPRVAVPVWSDLRGVDDWGDRIYEAPWWLRVATGTVVSAAEVAAFLAEGVAPLLFGYASQQEMAHADVTISQPKISVMEDSGWDLRLAVRDPMEAGAEWPAAVEPDYSGRPVVEETMTRIDRSTAAHWRESAETGLVAPVRWSQEAAYTLVGGQDRALIRHWAGQGGRLHKFLMPVYTRPDAGSEEAPHAMPARYARNELSLAYSEMGVASAKVRVVHLPWELNPVEGEEPARGTHTWLLDFWVAPPVGLPFVQRFTTGDRPVDAGALWTGGQTPPVAPIYRSAWESGVSGWWLPTALTVTAMDMDGVVGAHFVGANAWPGTNPNFAMVTPMYIDPTKRLMLSVRLRIGATNEVITRIRFGLRNDTVGAFLTPEWSNLALFGAPGNQPFTALPATGEWIRAVVIYAPGGWSIEHQLRVWLYGTLDNGSQNPGGPVPVTDWYDVQYVSLREHDMDGPPEHGQILRLGDVPTGSAYRYSAQDDSWALYSGPAGEYTPAGIRLREVRRGMGFRGASARFRVEWLPDGVDDVFRAHAFGELEPPLLCQIHAARLAESGAILEAVRAITSEVQECQPLPRGFEVSIGRKGSGVFPRPLIQRRDNRFPFGPPGDPHRVALSSVAWVARVVSVLPCALSLAWETAGPYPNAPHFRHGWAEYGDGMHWQRRAIADHYGPATEGADFTIDIERDFRALHVNDLVTLYPGYDGTWERAQTLPDPASRAFFGFPHLPLQHPAQMATAGPGGKGK